MNQMAFIEEALAVLPPLVSINQTTKTCNLGRTSVYRLIDKGELDAVRIHVSTDGKTSTRITNQSVRNLLVSWSTQST